MFLLVVCKLLRRTKAIILFCFQKGIFPPHVSSLSIAGQMLSGKKEHRAGLPASNKGSSPRFASRIDNK